MWQIQWVLLPGAEDRRGDRLIPTLTYTVPWWSRSVFEQTLASLSCPFHSSHPSLLLLILFFHLYKTNSNQNLLYYQIILMSNLIYKYNAIDSFIFVFSIPGVFGKEYLFHENKTFLFALYDMFSVISAPLEPCPSIKTRQLISSF